MDRRVAASADTEIVLVSIKLHVTVQPHYTYNHMRIKKISLTLLRNVECWTKFCSVKYRCISHACPAEQIECNIMKIPLKK